MRPPELDPSWEDDELTDLDSEDEDELKPEPALAPVTPAPATPAPAPPARPKPNASTSTAVAPRAITTRESTQRATQQSLQKTEPKKNAYLPLPNVSSVTAQQVYGWLMKKSVDLNPDYQRDVVWNESKQMNLIDSLHHNYYVPPLIFAATQTETGGVHRVCIDGKQRLTSIRRFISGEIPHKDSVTNRKVWWCNTEGTRRKLVSDVWKTEFDDKLLTVVDFRNLLPEQEREIFQRVQLGVTLTPAERLQANNGPYADLVRDLRKRVNAIDAFSEYSEWGSNRGKDFQTLAQIVYCIQNVKSAGKKFEPTIARLEAFLHLGTGAGIEKLRDSVEHVLDIFCRILHRLKIGTAITRKLYPLEFVMICLLIHTYMKKLTDSQLAEAIRIMCDKIRASNDEVRFNIKTFTEMLKFVQKEVPVLRLKLDPNHHATAAAEPRPGMASLGPEHIIPAPIKPTKRSRSHVSAGTGTEDEEPIQAMLERKAKSKAASPRKRKKLQEESDDEGGVVIRANPPPKPLTPASRGSLSKLTTAGASTGSTTRVKRSASKSKPPSESASSIAKQTLTSPISATSASASGSTLAEQQVVKPSVRPPPVAKAGTSQSTMGPPTSTTPLSSLNNTPNSGPVALPNATPVPMTAPCPTSRSGTSTSSTAPAPDRIPSIPLPSRSQTPPLPRQTNTPILGDVKLERKDSPNPAGLTVPRSNSAAAGFSALRAAKAKVKQGAAKNAQGQAGVTNPPPAQQPTPPESTRSFDAATISNSNNPQKKLAGLNLKFTKTSSFAISSGPAPASAPPPVPTIAVNEAAFQSWVGSLNESLTPLDTTNDQHRMPSRVVSAPTPLAPLVLEPDSNFSAERNSLGSSGVPMTPLDARMRESKGATFPRAIPNPTPQTNPLSRPAPLPTTLSERLHRGTKRPRSRSPSHETLANTPGLSRRGLRLQQKDFCDSRTRDPRTRDPRRC